MGFVSSSIHSSASPLWCLLENLKHLKLVSKPIHYYIQTWPQYSLDNDAKGLPNSTFDPIVLRDLYNYYNQFRKLKVGFLDAGFTQNLLFVPSVPQFSFS